MSDEKPIAIREYLDEDHEQYDWVCQGCKARETDEDASTPFCEDPDPKIVHDCSTGYFYCPCEYCESAASAQAYDDDMDAYLLDKAGGLDEVQRQERLRYYGEE